MENNFQINIPTQHVENLKYSRYVQPLNQNVFNLINNAIIDLKPNWKNERILDIGCNIGNLVITSQGSILPENYTGIDIQEYPITIARTNLPAYNFILCGDSQRAFKKDSTAKLKISEYLATQDKFDVVICHGLFPHFDLNEIKKMSETVKNNLNDDGMFVFSFWSHMHLKKFSEHLQLRLNIELNSNITNHELVDHIYLINRNQIVYESEQIDTIDNIDWLETFHEPVPLKQLVGNFEIMDVGKSYHTIARIFKNDIL